MARERAHGPSWGDVGSLWASIEEMSGGEVKATFHARPGSSYGHVHVEIQLEKPVPGRHQVLDIWRVEGHWPDKRSVTLEALVWRLLVQIERGYVTSMVETGAAPF